MTVLFFIVPGLGTLNNPNYTAFQFTNIVPPAYIRMNCLVRFGNCFLRVALM